MRAGSLQSLKEKLFQTLYRIYHQTTTCELVSPILHRGLTNHISDLPRAQASSTYRESFET